MDGERSACMVAKCHSQNCEEAILKAKDCVWQTIIAQVMLDGNGSGAPKQKKVESTPLQPSLQRTESKGRSA